MTQHYEFPSPDALLDVSVVKTLLGDLTDAFPSSAKAKNPEGMLRTYRMHLAGVSEEAARGAVRSIIRNDDRYPSVKRVLEAAHEWTRRNKASPEFQLRHDPNRCQACGESFVVATRWRPKLVGIESPFPAGSIALTPDREAIYLEPYTRDVCGCHVACKYTPDIDPASLDKYGDRPTMPIALAPPHDQHRILDQLTRRRGSWRRTESTTPTIADEAKRIAVGAGV